MYDLYPDKWLVISVDLTAPGVTFRQPRKPMPHRPFCFELVSARQGGRARVSAFDPGSAPELQRWKTAVEQLISAPEQAKAAKDVRTQAIHCCNHVCFML